MLRHSQKGFFRIMIKGQFGLILALYGLRQTGMNIRTSFFPLIFRLLGLPRTNQLRNLNAIPVESQY